MSIDIGKMRFRIFLDQLVTPVPNELGEVVVTGDNKWTQVAEVWASIRPLTSNEIIRARQVQLDTTHLITIRYFTGLTSAWRARQIVYDSVTIFNIRGVKDPDMLQVFMQLECVVSTDG